MIPDGWTENKTKYITTYVLRAGTSTTTVYRSGYGEGSWFCCLEVDRANHFLFDKHMDRNLTPEQAMEEATKIVKDYFFNIIKDIP